MKVTRSMFQRYRQEDAIATKERNTKVKRAERARRDARMITRCKKGSLPYTPDIMSWLSRKLDKPANRITDADVQSVCA